jgi:hypothetical protein
MLLKCHFCFKLKYATVTKLVITKYPLKSRVLILISESLEKIDFEVSIHTFIFHTAFSMDVSIA